MFQKVLKKLKENKNYALVILDNDMQIPGYITDYDKETFTIKSLTSVPQKVEEVYTEEEGLVHVVDPESDEYMLVEATHHVEAIDSIIHDISHSLPPGTWNTIRYYQEMEEKMRPKKAAKKQGVKRQKVDRTPKKK